jgi:hypothetical protein
MLVRYLPDYTVVVQPEDSTLHSNRDIIKLDFTIIN